MQPDSSKQFILEALWFGGLGAVHTQISPAGNKLHSCTFFSQMFSHTHQSRQPLFCSSFNFIISYRSGSKNTKPNTLSRQVSPEYVPILPLSCVMGLVTQDVQYVIIEALWGEPNVGTGPPRRTYIPCHPRVGGDLSPLLKAAFGGCLWTEMLKLRTCGAGWLIFGAWVLLSCLVKTWSYLCYLLSSWCYFRRNLFTPLYAPSKVGFSTLPACDLFSGFSVGLCYSSMSDCLQSPSFSVFPAPPACSAGVLFVSTPHFWSPPSHIP